MADIADRGSEIEEMQRQRGIEMATHRVAEEPVYRDGWRVCLDCGDTINIQRLEANPHAVRCVPCQSIREGDA